MPPRGGKKTAKAATQDTAIIGESTIKAVLNKGTLKSVATVIDDSPSSTRAPSPSPSARSDVGTVSGVSSETTPQLADSAHEVLSSSEENAAASDLFQDLPAREQYAFVNEAFGDKAPELENAGKEMEASFAAFMKTNRDQHDPQDSSPSEKEELLAAAGGAYTFDMRSKAGGWWAAALKNDAPLI